MKSRRSTLLSFTAAASLSVLAAGLAATAALAQKKTDWVYGDKKVEPSYWVKTDPKALKVEPNYGVKVEPKYFDPKYEAKYAPKYDPKK